MMEMVKAEMEPEIGDMIKQLVLGGFPDGATIKEPTCPCRRQMRIRSLAWKDPLEKGTATHCSILAWKVPYSP